MQNSPHAHLRQLLLAPSHPVTCPQCAAQFTLAEGVGRHLLEGLEEASARELEKVQALAKQSAAGAAGLELTALKQTLAAKEGELKTAQAAELALRKQRRDLEELQAKLELEIERRVDADRTARDERIRAEEAQKAKLREADLRRKNEELTKAAAELQNKVDKGSQQLQGDVLEVLLHADLCQAFRHDTLVEVKTGARGSDVEHTVNTTLGQPAGLILWEAKRTQAWSNLWVDKLLGDVRKRNAVAGVIVTTSPPKDFPPGHAFALHKGVWVTRPEAAVALATALREGVLGVHLQRLANANRTEKKEAVYDYLTSPQFAQKIRAMYRAFESLRNALESEKKAYQRIWASREKQLSMAANELLGIAGDLQGLAQQDLPQLELVPIAQIGLEEVA